MHIRGDDERGYVIWEVKCGTPFPHAHVLGLGSNRCGGAPSTADGGYFAWGNTKESLIKKTFGLRQRGSGGPLDRNTGIGRVDACRGHYTDALQKGHKVHLLVTETTGALTPDVVNFVRQLDKYAKANKSDTTAYGLMKGLHSSFVAHHLCCISESIVSQEVTSLHAHAIAMASGADHDLKAPNHH